MTVGNLHKLEVLCVDQQAIFGDETLKILGRECPCIRTLSCVACYGVSDSGITCLSSCPQLNDINISYCNKVTDHGLCKILQCGLRRICMRACQSISDTSIVQLASVCLMLQELDVSGCLGVSSKCLAPLLHLILYRDTHTQFNLLAGGSCIDEDAAMRFAEASDLITVNLRDFSLPSLSADYDPYLFIPPLGPPEDQESEEEEGIDELVHLSNDTGQSETHENDHNHHHRDFLLEQAEDFLIADDPAMFSDEFSDPEEWGFT